MAADARGVSVWTQDPNVLCARIARDLRPTLGSADVLAGRGPAGEQAAWLTAHVAHAVVKQGAEGALWATRGGHLWRGAASRVLPKDPTGAGDAFAAGLLDAWCSEAGPEAALAAGATLGAEAVAQVGARPR